MYDPHDAYEAAQDEAEHRASQRRFMLEIKGYPYRFYNGTTPPTKVFDSLPNPDVNFIDLPAFRAVDDIHFHQDDETILPVVKYDRVGITLATDAWQDVNVGDLFGRRDRTGCTWHGQVLETVSSSDPFTLRVDRDNTSLPVDAFTGLQFPRYLYGSGQTIRTTGAQVSAGGGWEFTGCTRGAGGTLRKTIRADSTTGNTPVVTTEPYTWNGRLATLYVQHYPGGPYEEVMHGELIDEVEHDGPHVHLGFNPIPSVLDFNVTADQLATELVTDYHLFQRVGCRVEFINRLRRNAALNATIDAAVAINDSQIESLELKNKHGQFFDNLSSGNLGVGHPRNGPVQAGGQGEVLNVTDVLTVAGGDAINGLDLDPNEPDEAIAATKLVGNANVSECITAFIADDDDTDADSLVKWPDGLWSAINNAKGWNRASFTGEYGSWARIQADSAGPSLTIQRLTDPCRCEIYLYRGLGSDVLADASRWWKDDDGNWNSEPPARPGVRKLPADVWAPTAEQEVNYALDPGDPNGKRVRCPVPAEAFYIPGEDKLLVRDTVPIPTSSGELTVRLILQDDTTVMAQVTASAAVLDGATTIGYALTLADRHITGGQRLPLIVQQPTGQPVRVVPFMRFWGGQTSGAIMLEVICSVEGNGVNGPYDRQPVGLGIPQSMVDVDSFLAVTDPPGIDWRPHFTGKFSALDVFGVMGLLTGSMIDVVRFADGTAKLARIPIPVDADPPELGALAVNPRPESAADDRIWNVIEWTANPDENGEPTFRAPPSVNQGSAAKHRPRPPAKIYIPGDIATDGASVRSVLGAHELRVFQRFAESRAVWRGSTDAQASYRIHANARVKVTSDLLRGANALGVTDGVGIVKSGAIGMQSAAIGLKIEAHFVKGSYWNLSALVTGRREDGGGSPEVHPDVDTVTYPNAQTLTLDPSADGQGDVDDVAYFVVGDVLDCCPAGDYDSKVTRTVIGVHVADNQITVDDASGLVAPDWGDLIVTSYDSASSTRRQGLIPKRGGFFADTASTLGAAADPGVEVL